jgi:hypothetical protein
MVSRRILEMNVRASKQILATLAALLMILATGCASSSGTATDESFGNFLVLGIADDYEGRSRYERSVASELRKLGVTATPYHEAVGGKGNISRETASELIEQHGFDAVLVTQVRNSSANVKVSEGSAAAKVTRKNDKAIDFFRYDYEELDEPGEMSLLAEAKLDTDLHRASDGEIVWSSSWSSKSAENVGILVDHASADVVRRLDRAKLVKR